LIRKSGLLILDEPTNYLDQEGISKLKDVLKKSRNTLIVISHLNELSDIFDRKFELENGSLREVV
jgi:ATPase subunit of ABC transporter with duplicated ATPase domains